MSARFDSAAVVPSVAAALAVGTLLLGAAAIRSTHAGWNDSVLIGAHATAAVWSVLALAGLSESPTGSDQDTVSMDETASLDRTVSADE